MPVEITKNGTTIITGQAIDYFRMRTLLSGLKLELKGLKMSRGVSCYAIIKKEFGLRGNKQKVFDQFKAQLDKLIAQ